MNLGFKKPNWMFEEVSDRIANVYVTPLERGYAHTHGNSLRRVLLTSIPGTAVIGFKVDGINHEFQTIPGTVNDGTELIVRLKEMKFLIPDSGFFELKFEANKAGTYYAKDISLPEGLECLTPDIELVKLTGKSDVSITFYVKRNRGYVSSKNHEELNTEEHDDVIKINGDFSPVVSVAVMVNDIRVGQDTNYQELKLEVKTDGTVSPKAVVVLAAEIIRMQLSFVEEMVEYTGKYEMLEEDVQKENEILDAPISTLNLSARPQKCLTNFQVDTIGKLISLTFSQLKSIDQLGKTSINEILEKLESIGYRLKEE